MVKICQTGLLKLNLENRPKNAFSGFCQKFPQAMDEFEKIFLPISKSLGPYGVRDGWLYLKMWKKSKSLHPYVRVYTGEACDLLFVFVLTRFTVFQMQHFRAGSESLYRRKKPQRHSHSHVKNDVPKLF